MKDKKLHLLGYASGAAGADPRSAEGPLCIQKSPYLPELANSVVWDAMIESPPLSVKQTLDEAVKQSCEDLAQKVAALTQANEFFSVVGGDHACAIGTWSGVHAILGDKGDIGLIWIDAHMDSHTPETSESGRIHGMPLASLMGYGFPTLANVHHAGAKLKPENICLIGVRSFERGEAQLLKRLNVRIYFMDEVKQRGLADILPEAVAHVSRHTIAYGISLDLDAIDPTEAPGVDVPEPDGLKANELFDALAHVAQDPHLVGVEVVEFDPVKDKQHQTEKLVIQFLKMMTNK